MSRAELWRVRTGRRTHAPTDRMKWGQDHEFRGVAAVETFQGVLYANTGKAQKRHSMDAGGYDLVAIPDGVYVNKIGGRTGLEVKCPEKLHEQLRPYIVAQTQFEAFVCDFQYVTVIEWTFQGYRIWIVQPSSEYINAARPLIDEFMGYMRDDKEPPRLKRAPVMPGVDIEMVHEELKDDIPF